mgnify:CR=1 FL=1
MRRDSAVRLVYNGNNYAVNLLFINSVGIGVYLEVHLHF